MNPALRRTKDEGRRTKDEGRRTKDEGLLPFRGPKDGMREKDDDLDKFKEDLLNGVLDHIKPLIEPVSVDYSNTVLADQIYFISIILFILSLLIAILIAGLLLNTLIFVSEGRRPKAVGRRP